ncbi:MAG: hypothetical protein LIQ30_10715 [Planctomycetes bacterium]|nr:hypothetical protein [Planctomycetota bacterium]MCD7895656.1 hypothetical protein [Planctomycetaceae bacterium]
MAKHAKTQIIKAPTYTEAVAKAKMMLGADFSIVSRRDIKEKTLFSKFMTGKLGGDALAVELEVAPGPVEPPSGKRPEPARENPLLRSYTKALEGVEKHSPSAKAAMAAAAKPFVSVGETTAGIAGRLDEFQKELQATRREYAEAFARMSDFLSLQARGGMPAASPALIEYHRRLIQARVAEAVSRDIVEEIERDRPGVPDGPELERLIRDAVARRLPCAGPVLLEEGKPTVIALVGPSGVGKSTSIVKLAIHFAMHRGKSIGLINEDLRRPGADGQINNLGRMLGVSVSTATEPGEIRDVVKSMSGRDVVLIDTGGRSPRDATDIRRLQGILEAAGADEIHLLLSGVSSEDFLRDTVERYRPSGFNRILLSKLDECFSFGAIVNLGSDLDVGFSYLTTGPDYNRPIEQAEAASLAELVLGRRRIEPQGDDNGESSVT